MPIQKDRSKDIPGKDGYSVRDAEKLLDAIRNYVPEDETGGNNKNGCFRKFIELGMILIVIIQMLKG